MYKNQKVQLKSDRKETNPKPVEAAVQKLQSLKLETPKIDFNPSIENINHTPQSTKQAAKVLTISEASVQSKPVSKNNHKTPTRNKVILSVPEDSGTPKNNSKQAANQVAPKKVTATENGASKIPEAVKVNTNQTQEKQLPKTSKIYKPDPLTICTCESLKPKEEPAPVFIPKRQEPINVPIYRWIAVKSESLKTDEEKAAEINLLLPKKETPKDTRTNTNRYRKPRLCPFCWNNVRNAQREAIQRRERELIVAQQTENKRKTKVKKAVPEEKSIILNNNRFGYLLGEESA